MKTQRQAKIMEIISTRDIETQERLLEALQDEGFYSTQATISRDIKRTPGCQGADLFWNISLFCLGQGWGGNLLRPAEHHLSGVYHQL